MSYSFALSDKGDGCCVTVASAVLKVDIAYRGRVSVIVAITIPTKLAKWPGGCSGWCSGLADSITENRDDRRPGIKSWVEDTWQATTLTIEDIERDIEARAKLELLPEP